MKALIFILFVCLCHAQSILVQYDDKELVETGNIIVSIKISDIGLSEHVEINFMDLTNNDDKSNHNHNHQYHEHEYEHNIVQYPAIYDGATHLDLDENDIARKYIKPWHVLYNGHKDERNYRAVIPIGQLFSNIFNNKHNVNYGKYISGIDAVLATKVSIFDSVILEDGTVDIIMKYAYISEPYCMVPSDSADIQAQFDIEAIYKDDISEFNQYYVHLKTKTSVSCNNVDDTSINNDHELLYLEEESFALTFQNIVLNTRHSDYLSATVKSLGSNGKNGFCNSRESTPSVCVQHWIIVIVPNIDISEEDNLINSIALSFTTKKNKLILLNLSHELKPSAPLFTPENQHDARDLTLINNVTTGIDFIDNKQRFNLPLHMNIESYVPHAKSNQNSEFQEYLNGVQDNSDFDKFTFINSRKQCIDISSLHPYLMEENIKLKIISAFLSSEYPLGDTDESEIYLERTIDDNDVIMKYKNTQKNVMLVDILHGTSGNNHEYMKNEYIKTLVNENTRDVHGKDIEYNIHSGTAKGVKLDTVVNDNSYTFCFTPRIRFIQEGQLHISWTLEFDNQPGKRYSIENSKNIAKMRQEEIYKTIKKMGIIPPEPLALKQVVPESEQRVVDIEHDGYSMRNVDELNYRGTLSIPIVVECADGWIHDNSSFVCLNPMYYDDSGIYKGWIFFVILAFVIIFILGCCMYSYYTMYDSVMSKNI